MNKIASAKLPKVSASINGFYVYQRRPNFGEKLNYVLDKGRRHSNTAIKVV